MQTNPIDKSTMLNEKAIFILDIRNGTIHYSHYFGSGSGDMGVQAGYVSAISRLAYEYSDPKESPTREFSTSETVYLMERGQWVIGVVVAAIETSDLRAQLRTIVENFESRFGEFHTGERFDNALAADFNDFVMRVFLAERIWERTLLKRMANLDDIMLSKDVRRFVLRLRDYSLTIADAAYTQNLSIAEAIEYALKACWSRAAYGLSPVSLHEILIPTERASAALLGMSGFAWVSRTTAQAVARMDGRMPTLSILEEAPIDELDLVSYELGALTSGGFVARVSNGAKKMVEYEKVLTAMVQTCTNLVGHGVARRYFDEGRAKAAAIIPWVEAVKIHHNGTVTCPPWGRSSINLKEESIDAGLGKLVSEIKGCLSVDIGYERARSIVDSLLSDTGIDMGFMGSLLEFLDRLREVIQGI